MSTRLEWKEIMTNEGYYRTLEKCGELPRQLRDAKESGIYRELEQELDKVFEGVVLNDMEQYKLKCVKKNLVKTNNPIQLRLG